MIKLGATVHYTGNDELVLEFSPYTVISIGEAMVIRSKEDEGMVFKIPVWDLEENVCR